MSYYTFPWYFQRFTDDSGAPLAGGSVTFYAAGSTAKKNIYLDQSGTIAPNPMPLDSVGFPESNYFGGPGEYDIYIKDSEGALVRKVLRVTSGGSGGFPDPTNSGYLHYDVDTDTYTWQEVDSDTYKVMTDSTDPAPDYLETKIVSSSEVVVTNTDHELSMTVDPSVKYKVKVNTDDTEPGYLEQKLSDNVDVQWTPTADNKQLESIVYQLTGLGSALSPVKTDFQYLIHGPFVDRPWDGGRGIAFGKIYVNGEHVNAWVAQSNSGHLYKTIDLWQTTIKDENDQPDASFYTRYGFPNSYGVGCISYVYMSNIGKNAWIVGVGNLARVYYVPDEPASYETNGFFKSTAWASIDYASTVCSSPIDISFDAETHDTCFLGDDVKIGYTSDFTTFTTAYTHTGIIAGIDNDGYGNVLACGKFDGVLFKSTDHGKPGTWAPISSIYLDGELVTHLPNSSEKGCQWGSVIGAYGQWAVFNYATVAGAPSFVWSDDGVYWYSYYGAVANFYGAGFDGVRFFATNPKINTNPPVYQVMISSIPSHRKFVAEKGLAVAGETFLYDIQDAQALGTDIHGRVVAKPLPAGSLAGLTDVALGTPENGQVLTFDEGSGKWINSAGGGYILPIASETALGGIKVGDRLSIDGSGVLSAEDQSYILPTASVSTKGGVLVGARLAIAPDGVLSADDQSYTLPVATDTVLGGVKEGANVDIAADGTISVAAPYSLPTASSTVLGGIKVGDRLSIADGVLSAADQAYTLPAASDTVRGGIKVGDGLSIVGDVLSADGFTPVPATTTTLGEVIVGDNISVDLTGKISVAAPYSLPEATASVLGGIKVGDRLSVAAGVLSADDQSYTLPTASASVLGGIKVGTNLSIDGSGVLSADAAPYSLPTASASVLGGVKVGDRLSIADGVLAADDQSYSLPVATDTVLGGVKIGDNIDVTVDGTISSVDPLPVKQINTDADLPASGEVGYLYHSMATGHAWSTNGPLSDTQVGTLYFGYRSICTGPDGKLYATIDGGNIVQGTVSGTSVTWVNTSAPIASWQSICLGPDNALYACDQAGYIYRGVVSGGSVTWTDTDVASLPWRGICTGPDGYLYAIPASTGSNVNLYRGTITAGVLTLTSTGIVTTDAWQMTAGPDGYLYIARRTARVLRVDVNALTAVEVGTLGYYTGICTGPDGYLYICENGPVYKYATTPTGIVRMDGQYTINDGQGIGIGPDGLLYLTSYNYGIIQHKPAWVAVRDPLAGTGGASAPYVLPTATASVLGGVKIGTRLTIDGSGVLSADDQSYTLPEATSTVLGGVKVGNGLQVDTGVIRCDDATVFKSQNAGASGLGYWTKILSINAPETNDHVSMRLQLTSSYTSIAMGVWHIDIESRNLAATPAPTVSLIQGDGSYAATDVVVVVVNDYPTEPRLYEIWTRAIANYVEVGWTVRDIWSATGASPVTWTNHSDTAWVASYSAGTAYPGADGRNIYTLPTASSTVKGGIKVGSGLSITTEVLDVTSAPILATARNLTIGSSTKSFNGSADVSWTLSEIGAQAALTNPITGTGTGGRIAVWSSSSTQTSYAGVTCDGTTIVSPGLAASAQGLGLANATPSTTTNTLYNVGGTLYWSGNALGGISGSGSAGKLGIWSSATGMTYDNNVSYASSTLSVPNLTTTATSSGVSTASIDVTGTLNTAGGFGIKLASVFPSVGTDSRLYNVSGNLYWSGAIVGNVRGGTSGVANRVAYWTGTNSITSDADLTFDGTTLTATAASVGQGIELTSYTPGTVTNKLYNVGGALYWNGTAVGSNLTGTIYSVPHFDGSGNIVSDAGFTVQQNTDSLSSYFYFGTSATNTSLTINAKSGTSESSNFRWYRGTGDGFTNHVFGIVTGDTTTYFNGYGGNEFMRIVSGSNYPKFPSSIWLPTTAGNVIYLDSNQVATGNSGLTYDGTSLTVTGGVVLPSGAPSTTTNKLYSVGGILYFNGVIVGGSSTGVFGNALINTSTNDGAAAFLGLNGYNGVLNTSSGIIAAATYMAVCNPGDVSVYAGSQSTRQFAVKSAEVATYVPTTIGSKLTLNSGLVASYDTLTANTTLVESTACYQQYINWSASTITVTLPASPTVGRKYAFGSAGKQWTLASGSTNIYVSGSSTAVSSVVIPASQPLIEVVYMGTSWFVA